MGGGQEGSETQWEGIRTVLRRSGREGRVLRRSGRGQEDPKMQCEGRGAEGRVLRHHGRSKRGSVPLTPAVWAGFGDPGPKDKWDGLFSKKWQSKQPSSQL